MDGIILDEIKQLILVDKEYIAFDEQILIYINNAVEQLKQIGVVKKIVIEKETVWKDLVKIADLFNHMIKTYIYLKVKKMFDPPSTQVLLNAIDEQLKEIEVRLYEEYNYFIENKGIELSEIYYDILD